MLWLISWVPFAVIVGADAAERAAYGPRRWSSGSSAWRSPARPSPRWSRRSGGGTRRAQPGAPCCTVRLRSSRPHRPNRRPDPRRVSAPAGQHGGRPEDAHHDGQPQHAEVELEVGRRSDAAPRSMPSTATVLPKRLRSPGSARRRGRCRRGLAHRCSSSNWTIIASARRRRGPTAAWIRCRSSGLSRPRAWATRRERSCRQRRTRVRPAAVGRSTAARRSWASSVRSSSPARTSWPTSVLTVFGATPRPLPCRPHRCRATRRRRPAPPPGRRPAPAGPDGPGRRGGRHGGPRWWPRPGRRPGRRARRPRRLSVPASPLSQSQWYLCCRGVGASGRLSSCRRGQVPVEVRPGRRRCGGAGRSDRRRCGPPAGGGWPCGPRRGPGSGRRRRAHLFASATPSTMSW